MRHINNRKKTSLSNKGRTFLLYATGIFFLITTTVSCSHRSTIKIAQETAPSNALLWKIEGKDLAKPSYLFGTIHLIPQDKFLFNDVMNKAFSECDEIVFEIDMNIMNDFSQMFGLLSKIRMPDDMTIKDLLSEDDYKLFQDKFADKGLPAFLLETIKPLFISTLADGMDSPNQSMISYEIELANKANDQNKTIGGLETIDDQLAAIDSIPLKIQAQMLIDELKKEHGENEYERLVALYIQQDIDALQKAINQGMSKDDQTMMNFLLKDRNVKWIPKMNAMMKDRPTFFAVGAGHLGGEYGVIKLLKEAGYKVSAIP